MTSRRRWAHRGGVAESTGWVTAGALLAGSAGVSTRLPADVTAIAVMVADDARVELELSGAHTEGEPIRVARDGHVVWVHALRRERGAAAITVTAAAGDGRLMTAVAGARLSAAALADRIRERGLPALVSRLLPGTHGDMTVSWRAPHAREAAPA
jgi:hypothetical protein